MEFRAYYNLRIQELTSKLKPAYYGNEALS